MVVVLEECVIFSLWNKCHERKSQGCDHIQKGWWMQLWRNQSSELVILDIPEIRWNSLLLHSSGCSVIIEDDKFPYDNRSSHSLTLTKNGFLTLMNKRSKWVTKDFPIELMSCTPHKWLAITIVCLSNGEISEDSKTDPSSQVHAWQRFKTVKRKERWALQGLKICKIGKINGKAATQLIILHISV